MKSQKLVAGIDVSKDTLDIYFNDKLGTEHALKVANDATGHQLVLERLGIKRTYVLESSGPYYLRLAFLIKSKGGDVRVENPICIKRFIQMNLERNKNDQKDARWIYHYAKSREVRAWQLPSKLQLECQQLMGAMELYKHQLVMLQNQLHSLEQVPLQCRLVIKSLKDTIAVIEAEIEHLDQKLQQRLQKWQGAQVRSLTSIPGLGKRAVALLIIYTDGFTKIQNHRQLIALAGMAPREYTSGT